MTEVETRDRHSYDGIHLTNHTHYRHVYEHAWKIYEKKGERPTYPRKYVLQIEGITSMHVLVKRLMSTVLLKHG